MPEHGRPWAAIVDCGMGNLYSVEQACGNAGLECIVTDVPDEVRAADAVILPGMGAMPDAMRTLDERGLSDALRQCAERGTPILGVCLGMQLLMRAGSEFGAHAGLGIIDGVVERFEGTDASGRALKVPHIGWNAVRHPTTDASWEGTPLARVPDDSYFYFVHSYYVVPKDQRVVAAVTTYGNVTFCSALSRGNIFACQFHPERSGPIGLSVYHAFAEHVRRRGVSRLADSLTP